MRIVDFVNATKEKVIEKLIEIAGPDSCTRETIPIKVGTAEVAAIRGGAIEKACMTHLVMNRVQPPEAPAPVDYMVFQLEIFPRNPYSPMGHFNTEWSITGPGPYHMNLDIFPAVTVEDDFNYMKQKMDVVADTYGVDKNALREGLDEHYSMDHFDKPLSSNAGCKLMHLQDDQLDLFIDAYHAFFDGYIDILTRQQDTPYSDDENRLKLQRNGKWLEYITLKDVAVKMGLSVGIPPEVIIKLSFPPSATF